MNDGSTPLDIDELKGIKIRVFTRKHLDNAECVNIARGIAWAKENLLPAHEMLTIGHLCDLHLHMFGDVWEWAGKFRKSDKNIGVPWPYIPEQLRNALDDAKAWVDFGAFSHEEMAARLHYRLVKIHPFVNGNGRITRIFASLVVEKLGCKPLEWSGLSVSSIQNTREIHGMYLDALRQADKGDYAALIDFCSSTKCKDNEEEQYHLKM